MRDRVASKGYWFTGFLGVIVCLIATLAGAAEPSADWKAGVASVVVTPDEDMWMAGYAARTKPSEGKIHDLRAKALALQDARGTRLVIVTLDLIGVPRELRDWLEQEVGRRYKLPPECLLVNASHTHCGPELRMGKAEFYDLPEERLAQTRRYGEALKGTLADLVGAALADLAPARLGFSQDKAGFAKNRRLKTDKGYQNSPNPKGPMDHDVPVLRVETPDGKLRAVLFGYACHNTTLSFYQFCGDYAGFAQLDIEKAHPGATAMFAIGCGADQNPDPRRTLELAIQHGRTLADAVERALAAPARPVRGPLNAAIHQIALNFAPPPSREELQELAKSTTNKYEKRHAEVLLQQMDQPGGIKLTYPYLVQMVRFGDDLTMVAMAGEVVVDYSLRLKRELQATPLWVMGYSNDVFGYLPSLRVLQEGGYEGGGAMIHTMLPGPFAPSVEDRVMDAARQLAAEVVRSR